MIEGALWASILFFAVSLFFSMFGKGGGEFYMPILVALLGLPYHKAAGITLFTLVAQGASMLIVYHKRHGLVDWVLAAIVGFAAMIAAFLGGLVAGYIPARILKLLFSTILVVSALLILRGYSVHPARLPGPGIRREVGGYTYQFNPLAAAVPASLIAFLAAMAGISGGSLIIPVLVVLGGVPLRVAVGTNPFLVLVSSTAGFLGHLASGGFDARLAAPLAAAAIAGSQLGARLHARLSDRLLRILFSGLMLLAAGIMALKAVY